MSEFLQLALLIATILLAAKAAGYLSVRLGQPSVLGELLVGILLGPSLLDLLHLPFITGHLGETIKELGELGVLLLIWHRQLCAVMIQTRRHQIESRHLHAR